MNAGRVHPFAHCRVEEWPSRRYLRTVFLDGTFCHAAPHDTDDYRATAAALGYGADTWAMCREHEMAHVFLAERLHDAVSATLYAVANDAEDAMPLDLRQAEESLVLDFQRLCNGVDPRCHPTRFFVIAPLVAEFVARVRRAPDAEAAA